MTINELKKYIYEQNKIQGILEELGCHEVKYNEGKEYWSATQPTGDNPQGVNIRNNEYLNYRSFSRGVSYDDGKDLISLVENVKNIGFIDALKYLHKILNLPFELKRQKEEPKKKTNPLNIFTRQLRSNRRIVNVDDINILDEELLDDFVPMLHIDWFKDGIMPWTREKFGLCYSYKRKRMIIPHRYWMTGQLVGMNMRTVVPNYEEFGIKKYMLTEGFEKHLNIYGLYENYESIQKAGYVVVYESERSVLKRDSLSDSTGVAISGHSLSQEQVAILIGLNVDIIISMDKDIQLEEVRHLCSKFHNIRNVYYTYDKHDLLGAKDSIADASNKVFNFLMKYKVKYDDNEHQEYLKSLNKK